MKITVKNYRLNCKNKLKIIKIIQNKKIIKKKIWINLRLIMQTKKVLIMICSGLKI
jgi:hypothetical protein